MKRATIDQAPQVLNTNDKAFWVAGWNDAVEALEASQKPAGGYASMEEIRAMVDLYSAEVRAYLEEKEQASKPTLPLSLRAEVAALARKAEQAFVDEMRLQPDWIDLPPARHSKPMPDGSFQAFYSSAEVYYYTALRIQKRDELIREILK